MRYHYRRDCITEIRTFQLIIDQADVILKEHVIDQWEKPEALQAIIYGTGFLFQNIMVYVWENGKKIPCKVEQIKNYGTNNEIKNEVKIIFPHPIQAHSSLEYELQFLLQSDIVHHIGTLNILEWPRSELDSIAFMRGSGKILFSSILGKLEADPKESLVKIVPLFHTQKLISHAKKASVIRFEWGTIPKFNFKYRYTVRNRSSSPILDFELKTYLPPTTKYQHVEVEKVKTIETNADENAVGKVRVGEIPPNARVSFEIPIHLTPLGNYSVISPNFGSWLEYKETTKPNSVGSALITPAKYWPTENLEIRTLVAAMKSESLNVSQFIQLAFEFVNQKIVYELNNERLNPLDALHARKGDCSEMADLMVTFLRTGGIPAKIVHGWVFVYETKIFEAHAWCEFFSPRYGWLQCDPTWGFLTGVSCQHFARHREGIIPDQRTCQYSFRGENALEFNEEVIFDKIE